MVDSIIDNHSLRTQRKGELKLEISLAATSEQLDRLVTGVKALTGRKEIESSTVLLSDISSNAYIITIDYFTGPITASEYNEVKEKLNFDVLKMLESLQVELAGANTDIRINQPVSS